MIGRRRYRRGPGALARLRRLFTLDRHAPMLLGFNSRTEFWTCVAPTVVVGVWGIVTQDLALVLYAGVWFFAAYVFFIALDQLRKFLHRIDGR